MVLVAAFRTAMQTLSLGTNLVVTGGIQLQEYAKEKQTIENIFADLQKTKPDFVKNLIEEFKKPVEQLLSEAKAREDNKKTNIEILKNIAENDKSSVKAQNGREDEQKQDVAKTLQAENNEWIETFSNNFVNKKNQKWIKSFSENYTAKQNEKWIKNFSDNFLAKQKNIEQDINTNPTTQTKTTVMQNSSGGSSTSSFGSSGGSTGSASNVETKQSNVEIVNEIAQQAANPVFVQAANPVLAQEDKKPNIPEAPNLPGTGAKKTGNTPPPPLGLPGIKYNTSFVQQQPQVNDGFDGENEIQRAARIKSENNAQKASELAKQRTPEQIKKELADKNGAKQMNVGGLQEALAKRNQQLEQLEKNEPKLTEQASAQTGQVLGNGKQASAQDTKPVEKQEIKEKVQNKIRDANSKFPGNNTKNTTKQASQSLKEKPLEELTDEKLEFVKELNTSGTIKKFYLMFKDLDTVQINAALNNFDKIKGNQFAKEAFTQANIDAYKAQEANKPQIQRGRPVLEQREYAEDNAANNEQKTLKFSKGNQEAGASSVPKNYNQTVKIFKEDLLEKKKLDEALKIKEMIEFIQSPDFVKDNYNFSATQLKYFKNSYDLNNYDDIMNLKSLFQNIDPIRKQQKLKAEAETQKLLEQKAAQEKQQASAKEILTKQPQEKLNEPKVSVRQIVIVDKTPIQKEIEDLENEVKLNKGQEYLKIMQRNFQLNKEEIVYLEKLKKTLNIKNPENKQIEKSAKKPSGKLDLKAFDVVSKIYGGTKQNQEISKTNQLDKSAQAQPNKLDIDKIAQGLGNNQQVNQNVTNVVANKDAPKAPVLNFNALNIPKKDPAVIPQAPDLLINNVGIVKSDVQKASVQPQQLQNPENQKNQNKPSPQKQSPDLMTQIQQGINLRPTQPVQKNNNIPEKKPELTNKEEPTLTNNLSDAINKRRKQLEKKPKKQKSDESGNDSD